jgi:23S rRNA (uridine2552-2'-O)-methyltransferase
MVRAKDTAANAGNRGGSDVTRPGGAVEPSRPPEARYLCVPAGKPGLREPPLPPKKNPYARPDHLTRAAKDAGFPARSIFKLEEIDRRTRLLRQGMRVLDLGATPGSWSLYAAQKIGRGGKLLAVDLEPLGAVLPPYAEFVQGDALSLAGEFAEQLARFAPYDVVLSDMAPRTTGNKVTDQARSFELFMRALAVAATLGKAGGAFVGKIFMSDDLPAARVELRKHYASERLIRPEGTRAVSTELYVIGQEKRS